MRAIFYAALIAITLMFLNPIFSLLAIFLGNLHLWPVFFVVVIGSITWLAYRCVRSNKRKS